MPGHDADVGDPESVAPGMRQKQRHAIGIKLRAPAERVVPRHRRVQFAIGFRFQKFAVAVLAVELILGEEQPILQRDIDRPGGTERRRIVGVGARWIERDEFARLFSYDPRVDRVCPTCLAGRSPRS